MGTLWLVCKYGPIGGRRAAKRRPIYRAIGPKREGTGTAAIAAAIEPIQHRIRPGTTLRRWSSKYKCYAPSGLNAVAGRDAAAEHRRAIRR